MILVKFLLTCVLCSLIGYTEGVPLKDAHNNHNLRHRRSDPYHASDDSKGLHFGLPSLPFSIPSPLSIVKSTLSGVGSLLASVFDDAEDTGYKNKRANSQKSADSLPVNSKITNEGVKSSQPSEVVQSNPVVPNIQPDENNKVIVNENINTEKQLNDTKSQLPSNEENTNKKESILANDGKSSISSDKIKGSISTEDYTISTSNYQSTTTDENIKRIVG